MTKLLLTVFTTALLATSAHADSLRGYIEKRSGVRYLQLQNDASNVALPISTLSPTVQASLAKLKEGDFLVARGAIGSDGKSVTVESIESLGLQALVGIWATEKLEVYAFHDFSELTLYLPSASGDQGSSKIVKAGDFHYAIAPDQGSRYSIFVSDNKSIIVGSIEFKKSRLKLTVVDPATGQVSSELVLSPLATEQSLK